MEQPNWLKELEDVLDLDNDCFCPYCDRTIEISNNDVLFSVNHHIKTNLHLEAVQLYRQNDISSEEKVNQDEESSQKNYSLNRMEDEDLIKLFMQLQFQHNYQYIVKYIIQKNNVVYCTLCDCNVSSSTSDAIELSSRLHSHMIELHLENIYKEVKSLPECDKLRELLEINDCKLKCNLCSDEIRVEDVKYTMVNVHKHFENKNHSNMSGRNSSVEVVSDLSNMSGRNTSLEVFSEKFSVNRYFMFMNIDGRYYCQLCNCLMDSNNESVLKHVKSKKHLILLKDKMIYFVESSEDNNCLDNPLRDETLIDVATCSYNEIKSNSELENMPKSIVNSDYEQLQNQLQNFVPAIIKKNQYFIVKFGKYYKCRVCNELLVYSFNLTRIKIIFKAHFKSLSHKNAVRLYLDLPPIEFNENQNTLDSTLSKKPKIYPKVTTKISKTTNNGYEELKNKFDETLPSAIERNKEYIIKVGKYYKCSLCEFLLSNTSEISRIVFVLKTHFRSLTHKNTVKQLLGLPLIEVNKKSGEISKKGKKTK